MYLKSDLISRACAAVFLACAALAGAAPALAQPQTVAGPPPASAAPTPEQAQREALALEVSRILDAGMGTPEMKARRLKSLSTWDELAAVRPEWKDTLETSASEALVAEMPWHAQILGHAYAKAMTLGELTKADAFLRSPAGAKFLHYVAEQQAGRTPAPLAGDARATLAKFTADPEGASFLNKLDHPGPEIAEADRRFGEHFIGAALTRFGAKAEAGEAARFEAHGPDTPAEKDAIAIIHLVYVAQAMDKQLTRAVVSDADRMDLFPEWPDIYRQAAAESVTAHSSMLQSVIGRSMAKSLTLGELKAGIAFLRTPTGLFYLKHAIAAGEGHTFVIPPPYASGVRRFEATATGRSFMAKFHQLEAFTASSASDLRAIIVAGMLYRFGEKATALSNSRPPL